MIQRFTDRARKVMTLANLDAQGRNDEFIDTVHVLIGLIAEGSGVGATVLRNLGVDFERMPREVKKLSRPGEDKGDKGNLPQTLEAKKVIKYAIEECRALRHSNVGTEHILLGLMRDSTTVAYQVLMNAGVRLEEVRKEMSAVLGC